MYLLQKNNVARGAAEEVPDAADAVGVAGVRGDEAADLVQGLAQHERADEVVANEELPAEQTHEGDQERLALLLIQRDRCKDIRHSGVTRFSQSSRDIPVHNVCSQ